LAAVEDHRRFLAVWIERAVLAIVTAIQTLSVVDTGQRIRTTIGTFRVEDGVDVIAFRTKPT
jgi:hypothetical protein